MKIPLIPLLALSLFLAASKVVGSQPPEDALLAG